MKLYVDVSNFDTLVYFHFGYCFPILPTMLIVVPFIFSPHPKETDVAAL